MAEHEMIKVDRSMLPPNKKESKKEETQEGNAPKLAPVVKKGTVVSTKPSLGKRIRSLFIAEDVEDVRGYLIDELVVPFIKDTILDLGELVLYGQTTGRRRSGRRRGGYSNLPTDYRASYNSPRDKERRRDKNDRGYSRRGNDVDYREIVLSDRNDAADVVANLHDRIRVYGAASVADLLELIDQSSVYTDTAYGWKNTEQIGMRKVGRGWLIDVDDAEPLDD